MVRSSWFVHGVSGNTTSGRRRSGVTSNVASFPFRHTARIWDYGDYDTALRRSRDGGKTWSRMEVLVDAGKSTVDNCVLIVDKKRAGVVHHLYCVDYARTVDGGLTITF